MAQRQQSRGRETDMMRNAVKGAIAGAAALWLMDRFDWYAYAHEDQRARRQTDAVRPGGMDPAHVMANRVARKFGTRLGPHRPHEHPAGLAIHYGLAIMPAVLYAMVRHRVPALRAGRGLLWGLGLFLAQDEGLNTLAGSGADPRAYPWQAHARGLVSHLLLGVLTDTFLDLMQRQNAMRGQARGQQAGNRPEDGLRDAPATEPFRPIPTAAPTYGVSASPIRQ